MMIGLDTETELISDREPAPRLDCMSYSADGTSDLIRYDTAPTIFRVIADSFGEGIVLHNAPYDMSVLTKHDPSLMPVIFDLYENGRIKDTLVREALQLIEDGKPMIKSTATKPGNLTLSHLAKQYLGLDLDKDVDSWRLRYGELRDVPLSKWPERARDYATADAASTLKVYEKQKDKPDEVLQTRSDWCLKLMSLHGVIADPERVNQFELGLLQKVDKLFGRLKDAGLIKEDGARDTKLTRRLIEQDFNARGLQPPTTGSSKRFPKGQIKYDEDTLDMCESQPALKALAKYGHLSKLLDTYVPILRRAAEHPVYCSYTNLVDTGRTSGSRPNWQNMPREPGARECIRARPGKAFVAVDYSVAELRALAQVCHSWLGKSALREAFLAGRDPHVMLAAELRGVSFETMRDLYESGDPSAKSDRQIAKSANFGLAGGLGPDRLVQYCKGSGIIITRDRAVEIREAWFRTWLEMRDYFRMITNITGDFGDHKIVQFGSERVRGNVAFTQAANGYFQGLVADMAKDAMWMVTKAAYTEGPQALFGSKPNFFIHDEIIVECDEERVHDVAQEMRALMEAAQHLWMPDVPPLTEAHAMIYWSKEAKPVFDKYKRLIPWERRIV